MDRYNATIWTDTKSNKKHKNVKKSFYELIIIFLNQLYIVTTTESKVAARNTLPLHTLLVAL